MIQQEKGINSFKLEDRKEDLRSINTLNGIFGRQTFVAAKRYFFSVGYEAGYDRLVRLIREGKFQKEDFQKNPVKGIRDFLHGFFVDRNGAMPKVWTEDDTVYLMTELDDYCVTIEAEKEIPVCHKDICNTYCRSEAEGLVSVFCDFFPGLFINFYNKSSKRKKCDCIEAFQVIYPE